MNELPLNLPDIVPGYDMAYFCAIINSSFNCQILIYCSVFLFNKEHCLKIQILIKVFG